MSVDVIVAHPSMAAIARDVAGRGGLRVELRENCPRNMVFEVDSSTVVTEDLRTGAVNYPYRLKGAASV